MYTISDTTRLGVIIASGLMLCLSSFNAYAKSPPTWRHIDSERVAELKRLMPARPAGLGPRCTDRQAWTTRHVQNKLKPFVATARKMLGQPFPPWSERAYLLFSQTGSRREGEAMMRARWRRLAPLVLAECAEAKGRFIPLIVQAITELAKQPTWTIPAHDSELLNLHQKQFHADLFASAMGHNLAQAVYMLDNWIQQPIRSLIMESLRVRIFNPILSSLRAGRHGWQGHWWIIAKNNWNAVCSAGVTGAALAVLEHPEERAIFVASAESSSRYYLDGFLDDGYSTEGLGYWNYGFSHFAVLRELLMNNTRNVLDLFAPPKVRLIARYGAQIEMFPGASAAFGDSPIGARPDPFTLAYNRAAFGGTPKHGLPDAPIDRVSLPMAAITLFSHFQPVASAPAPMPQAHTTSTYFPEARVLVSRAARPDGRFAATIKAGGNSAAHSHNDIGSYSVAFADRATIGDVGNTRYSKKTFGKQRYQIRAINSFGHPVPVVAGRLQRNAASVRVPVLEVIRKPQQDKIVINLAPAYRVPEMTRLTRTFIHQRRTLQIAPNVMVEDRFQFKIPLPFEVALTTRGRSRIEPDGSVLFIAGNYSLRAKISSSAPFDLRRETISEEGLIFTRYGIRIKTPTQAGSVRVIMIPSTSGSGAQSEGVR